jgi:hypothetical protein
VTVINISALERKRIPHQQVRDPNYWARRRAWWRDHKKQIGCDWPGIIRSQIEVADYLASLRRRS